MTKYYLAATRNCFLYIKDKTVSTGVQFSFQADTQVNLLTFNGILTIQHGCIWGQDLHIWTNRIYCFKLGNN